MSALAALLWLIVTIMYVANPEGGHLPIWVYTGLLCLMNVNNMFNKRSSQ